MHSLRQRRKWNCYSFFELSSVSITPIRVKYDHYVTEQEKDIYNNTNSNHIIAIPLSYADFLRNQSNDCKCRNWLTFSRLDKSLEISYSDPKMHAFWFLKIDSGSRPDHKCWNVTRGEGGISKQNILTFKSYYIFLNVNSFMPLHRTDLHQSILLKSKFSFRFVLERTKYFHAITIINQDLSRSIKPMLNHFYLCCEQSDT